MKILLISFVVLVLSSCSQKQTVPVPIEVTVLQVHPSELLDCQMPPIKKYNPDTLTEVQVATILYGYDYNIRNCYNDVQTISRIQQEYLQIQRNRLSL